MREIVDGGVMRVDTEEAMYKIELFADLSDGRFNCA